MSNTSRVEKSTKEDQIKDLYKTIPLIETSQEAEDFLKALLSLNEIERAARRWCCARKLMDGSVQRFTVENCTASRNMVTKVNAAFIKNGNHIGKIVYDRFIECNND